MARKSYYPVLLALILIAGLVVGGVGAAPSWIAITFDDSTYSVYQNATPVFDKYNYNATVYVIEKYTTPALPSNYMNVSTLTILYNKGWDLGNHANHTNLINLTSEEQAIQLSESESWLNSNGFTRASNHVAYPFGYYNDDTITAMGNSGMLTGRTTRGVFEQIPYSRPYILNNVRSMTEYNTNATENIYLTNLSSSDFVIYYGHTVSESYKVGAIKPTVLDYILNYAYSNNIPVLTISQAHAKNSYDNRICPAMTGNGTLTVNSTIVYTVGNVKSAGELWGDMRNDSTGTTVTKDPTNYILAGTTNPNATSTPYMSAHYRSFQSYPVSLPNCTVIVSANITEYGLERSSSLGTVDFSMIDATSNSYNIQTSDYDSTSFSRLSNDIVASAFSTTNASPNRFNLNSYGLYQIPQRGNATIMLTHAADTNSTPLGWASSGRSGYRLLPETSGYVSQLTIDYYYDIPLLAQFTPSGPVTVYYPNGLLFTDTSTGSPTAWEWYYDEDALGSPVLFNTSQNAYFVPPSIGNFSISLNASTTMAYDISTQSTWVNVTNATGFNQQGVSLTPSFTVTMHITDSTTGAPIPVVLVQDSNLQEYTTTNGTAYFTEAYGTVVFYLSATGYTSKAVSYIIDEDRTVTVQMVPAEETTISNWYTPWQVRIRALDYYGTPLPRVNITAYYVATSLPSTDTNWLISAFGITEAVASDMVNSSAAMMTETDDDGGASFVMFKSLKYRLVISNATQGVSGTKSLYPNDQQYDIRVAANGQTSVNNTLQAMGNTSLPVYQLNATAYNLSMIYHDTTGMTTNVVFMVKFRNGTTLYSQNLGNPGTTLVAANYTVINPGIGQELIWMFNATKAGV